MVSRENTLRARYPEDADARDIHADIDRTRDRMDRTVDEIGRRLDPRTLMSEALGLSGGADGPGGDTLRGVSRSIFEQVRRHPVPVILMGAGLVWLLSEEDEEPEHAAAAPAFEQPPAGHEAPRRTAPPPARPAEARPANVPSAVEEPRIEEMARASAASGQRPRT